MKILNIILIATLLNSCAEKKSAIKEILKPEFQSIIEANNVRGAVLIYDLKKDVYFSNNFDWAKVGRLPASTFKIANSIIALETSVVENDSTLFKWNGEKRAYKSWEQDLVFKDAFKYSCVPCYQEVARNIGGKKMNEYLRKIKFGDMKVTPNNIDVFWLEGESKINQFQQINFLKRFYKSALEISESTENIIKKILFIEKYKAYKLNGKTGLSVRNGNYNGWFVGYLESKENTYFFATNIEPKGNSDKKVFPKLRKKITIEALNTIIK